MSGRGSSAGQWRSTRATQRAVLDAARDIFFEMGYANASISLIVSRSRVSVGSIYHHFGGKAEIFEELWQAYADTSALAARNGTAAARAMGVTDPKELFIAGTVGYLSMLSEPGMAMLSRIFMPGDVPPGFDARVRRLTEEWIRRNAAVFGIMDTVEGRLKAAVVTAIVAEGEFRYAKEADPAVLQQIIDEVVSILRRVLS